MGELAVLGIFVGLWRALSATEQVVPSRGQLEAGWGWVLVVVSVLLALTATFPTSLTDTGDAPCRAATCSRPRAEQLTSNRGPITLTPAPGMLIQAP